MGDRLERRSARHALPDTYKEWRGRSSDERILQDRGYFVGKKIGSGTFATVRIAEMLGGERRELQAVKVINRSKASAQFLEKFLPRELQILSQIQHPHIIKVFSILHLPDKTYVFMELAKNGDVTDFVQKNGAVRETVARRWFIQVMEALRYCHRKDIAHRDLKCENILLDAIMNAKLTDFGFARVCKDMTTGKRVLSDTFCGSAAYVAPEVVEGHPYNPKMADVWSLGVCLYVMVNNSMPFDDTNISKMLQDQLAKKWQFRAKVEPHLSSDLKRIIHKMLEPNVIRRLTLEQVAKHPWIMSKPWF